MAQLTKQQCDIINFEPRCHLKSDGRFFEECVLITAAAGTGAADEYLRVPDDAVDGPNCASMCKGLAHLAVQ